MTGGGDFWARRKAAVEAEAAAETDRREAELQAARDARLAERPDAEILAELDLPRPEEMVSVDQVKALLRAQVPQRLKTLALRRMWSLNPVYANLDGLVDYDDDFTDAGVGAGPVQTIYQVGRGMIRMTDEVEAPGTDTPQDAAEDGATVDDGPEDRAPDETALAAQPGAGDTPAHDGAGDAIASDGAPDAERTEDLPPAGSRRMRFRFETAT